MVEPTNVKPRFFKALLIASDSGLVALMSDDCLTLVTIVLLSVNCQIYLSNEPYSF
jgi:hypothetical protein